jgi:hypothetical protein
MLSSSFSCADNGVESNKELESIAAAKPRNFFIDKSMGWLKIRG